MAGTKGYTAPEVLAGMQSDNRSDIYSVGLLFYEMLTGKNLLEPPFQIRPVKEADETLESWLDIVIEKATDFNQTMRYASLEDFVFDIENPHKIKTPKNRRKFILAGVLAAILLIAGVIAYTPWNKDRENADSTANSGSEYTTLLSLDFDSSSDEAFVLGYDDLGSQYSFSDSMLVVEDQVCEIDFLVESGMAVHYRVKGTELASVGLGPFNVTPFSRFECSYYDNELNIDYAVWDLKMQGMPIRGLDDFVDIIIYTTDEFSAVYAIVLDENSKTCACTAYKISEDIDNNLYIDICNFHYTDDDIIYVDKINVIEGSLKAYLADNFEAYAENKDAVDNLLDTPSDELKDIPVEIV